MGNATFLQASFIGGEWSKLAQGRIDSDKWRTALNLCRNYYPVEEGALLRRQGTRYLAHTKAGAPGRLLGFDFTVDAPYQMEFTDGWVRFYRGESLVLLTPGQGITDISTDDPAVVSTSGNLTWSSGDTVVFDIDRTPCAMTELCNRQFVATVTGNMTFSIADALTGEAIDGTELGWTADLLASDQVFKVLELPTPYVTGQWKDVRAVGGETDVVLLHNLYAPRVISEGGDFFQIDTAAFLDGPYLDENTTTTTMTLGAVTGSTTLTASSTTGINDGQGFLSTDVGRSFRIQSAPAAWASGTTYAQGDLVTASDDNVYTSLLAGNVGFDPTTNPGNWTLSDTGIVQSWGTIDTITSTTVVAVTIKGPDLSNTFATIVWRLGAFSDTTGWPTCGTYHEGRLCLSGAIGNRVDMSCSNDFFNFAPTSSDGTVADNNAIAAVANALNVNTFFWMASQEDGLYLGSLSGEWRIRASSLDDPLSPTSIQMRRVTTFGCAPSDVVTAPKTMLFVQRQQRKVIEFGNFNSYPDGLNLSLPAEHLTVSGIAELAWTQEPTPILWMRRNDGQLVGCSYMRNPDKVYAAWHLHPLGSERLVMSVSSGPTDGGLSDSLYLVTNDTASGVYWVELLTQMWDDQLQDWQAFFVDGGTTPCCAHELLVANGDPIDGVEFTGLWYLNGKTITPFVGGLDLGDWVVADGAISVPYGSDPDGIFTPEFLQGLTDEQLDFGDMQVIIDHGSPSGALPDIQVPALMAYVPGSGTVSNATNEFFAFGDWDGQDFLTFAEGTDSDSGIHRFNINPGGSEIEQLDVAHIFNGRLAQNGDIPTGVTVGDGVAYDGVFIYFNCVGTSNTVQTTKVKLSTLVEAGFFGISSASGEVGPIGFSFPIELTHVRVGVADLTLALSFEGRNVQFMYDEAIHTGGPTGDAFKGAVGGFDVLDPDVYKGLFICPGISGRNYATAYVIAMPDMTFGTTASFALYRITMSHGVETYDGLTSWPDTPNSFISFDLVGMIAPADVDATWSHFLTVQAPVFDQTDGNLVMSASTNDSVTFANRMFKLNVNDASVVWASELPSQQETIANRSRIVNGTYLQFFTDAGVGHISALNTLDGTFQSVGNYENLHGGTQFFDDVSNSLIVIGQYAETDPSFEYIGDYMSTHTSFSNGTWFRVYAGVIPGQDRSHSAARLQWVAPAAIGFTYTSQAQILRPDQQDGGAQNGPGFAKKRRLHKYGASLYRTRGISFGTVLTPDTVQLANLWDGGENQIPAPALFSGVTRDTINDDYSYYGQLAWTQTRPYPGLVTAVTGFIQTTDE